MNLTRVNAVVVAVVLGSMVVSTPQYVIAADPIAVKDLQLSVPDGWKQTKPTSTLRLAQFEIPAAEGDTQPAELTISSFGGDGGGTNSNLKRWVNQFQGNGRELKAFTGKSAQGEYALVDISGTYNKPIGPPVAQKTEPVPGSRMLGIVLTIEGKGNYFLKLTGPDKTVAAAADALRSSIGATADGEKPYELP